MVKVIGLTGWRPKKEFASQVTCPPYDVINKASGLEGFLKSRKNSLYHITLGDKPAEALARLIKQGILEEDKEPCFYVYEQVYSPPRWRGPVLHEVRTGETPRRWKRRMGVLLAAETADYAKGLIIRHEKTFAEKVAGRVKLSRETGYSLEPVFCLTKSKLTQVLSEVVKSYPTTYEFTSDFGGFSDLDGIKNRIFRVSEKSQLGQKIKSVLVPNSLYIADGHHRYQAALELKQAYFLAYVTDQATIQAYNRLINGSVKFSAISSKLDLQPTGEFVTPPKHQACFYSKGRVYLYRFLIKPGMTEKAVDRLDVSALEREVYPLLGINKEMIRGTEFIEYRPEPGLEEMRKLVGRGQFDLAIALHPVSWEELMAVADAGVKNPEIVMPEKSTYFSPKILSGIFILRLN